MGRECVLVIDRWLCSVMGDWGFLWGMMVGGCVIMVCRCAVLDGKW